MRANPSAVPWTSLFYLGLGGAALFRAFYRPQRTALRGSTTIKCATAQNCDPAVTLQASPGAQGVYAMAPGTVVGVGPGSVSIVDKTEPVLLDYTGLSATQVSLGDSVGIGQQLGLAHQLRFAVYSLNRSPDGSLVIGKPIEPSAWLAVHGLKSSTARGSDWCGGGRTLRVPQQVAQCGMELPQPGAFSLLPVNISLV